MEEEKALARQGVDAYFKSKLQGLNRALRRLHNLEAKAVRLEVDRNDVFRDSFRSFSRLSGEQLRGPLHVKFRKEDGRDDGGLTRHWFLLISREIVNPEYAMFAPVGNGNTSFQVRLRRRPMANSLTPPPRCWGSLFVRLGDWRACPSRAVPVCKARGWPSRAGRRPCPHARIHTRARARTHAHKFHRPPKRQALCHPACLLLTCVNGGRSGTSRAS